jgi:UDP-N-acetylmuramate--alanine ligase
MELKKIKRVYFLGIGGIGMSALARYFKNSGAVVSGYDKTPTVITQALQAEDIDVHYVEDVFAVPEMPDLVIYTPAIPADHKELLHIRDCGFPLYKRSEILGMLAKEMYCIAIAGTHGKTSISCITSHLLLQAGRAVNAFVGGISVNYNTNLILTPGATEVVVEADEYDRSFLRLDPDIAVVSAIDPDHLDIYKTEEALRESFAEFAGKIRPSGILIKNAKVTMPAIEGIKTYSYGLNDADFRAEHIRVEEGHFVFDLLGPGLSLHSIRMQVPGAHNVENAVAAAAIAHLQGVPAEQIREGLQTYRGVRRRFEMHVNTPSLVYVDDYAHHPEELKACIKAARDLFPHLPLIGIFQPHLFTRTRDLAADFSKALDGLDQIVLLPIYPARELPIAGVSSEMLSAGLAPEKCRHISKEEIPAFVSGISKGVILTMGAGDIDQWIEKIKTIVAQKAVQD